MIDLVQGSPEWLQARCGRVTASRVCDVIARTKTGYGASRANYMAQLIAERLTGEVVEGYTNAAMQWGSAIEPDARAAYVWRTDATIRLVGFVPHPRIDMTGASPDAYVGEDGLLELKAPQTATHIEYLLSGKVPEKYVVQMMWQLACTGRRFCDFASHDPRMPEEMRLFVKRLHRDDAKIEELEKEVSIFLAELAGKVAELKRLYSLPEAA